MNHVHHPRPVLLVNCQLFSNGALKAMIQAYLDEWQDFPGNQNRQQDRHPEGSLSSVAQWKLLSIRLKLPLKLFQSYMVMNAERIQHLGFLSALEHQKQGCDGAAALICHDAFPDLNRILFAGRALPCLFHPAPRYCAAYYVRYFCVLDYKLRYGIIIILFTGRGVCSWSFQS